MLEVKKIKLYTSEAVSEGHPDKVCDQISDAILQECLTQDKDSRVACEVMATYKKIIVSGEITTNSKVNYEQVVRDVLTRIGWTEEYFLDPKTFEVEIILNTQSVDIAQGVDKETNQEDQDTGAGDQGIMYGFATENTNNNDYMPVAYSLSQELVRRASELRKNKEFKFSGPDMKSQVTIKTLEDGSFRIDTLLMSIQHSPDYNEKEFKDYIKTNIMEFVAKKHNLNLDFKTLINPTGIFTIGGPVGDTGLTGRKIIVDTYGGEGRHGGGAFSGKDGTKMDRSGAYAARYIAKNIIASKIAKKAEVQLSYAIGKANPISINVETFNSSKDISYPKLLATIEQNFDLTPDGIIKMLNLKEVNYNDISCYGHFGRQDLDYVLPWEKLDKVDIFKKLLK